MALHDPVWLFPGLLMAGTDVGVGITEAKGDSVVALVGPRWCCGDVLAPGGTRKEGRR